MPMCVKVVILLLVLLLRQPASGTEQCKGLNGETYICDGFCCIGLGCCSFSNLWYAWMLLALLLILCACGCASCGARRYYVASPRGRGSNNGYRSIYYSNSSEISTEPIATTRRARQKRYYNATSNRPSASENNNRVSTGNNNGIANGTANGTRTSNGATRPEEPPPYTAPSAPPPYSYY